MVGCLALVLSGGGSGLHPPHLPEPALELGSRLSYGAGPRPGSRDWAAAGAHRFRRDRGAKAVASRRPGPQLLHFYMPGAGARALGLWCSPATVIKRALLFSTASRASREPVLYRIPSATSAWF